MALQPQLPQPSSDVRKRPQGDGDRVEQGTRATDRRPLIRSLPRSSGTGREVLISSTGGGGQGRVAPGRVVSPRRL
jgi:hypothetical protein